MTAELNETFMVRSSTPEMNHDETLTSVEKIQTKLTQVQLKATLSNDENQQQSTQRPAIPSMELVILPKAQADIVVNRCFFLKWTKIYLISFNILVAKRYRS